MELYYFLKVNYTEQTEEIFNIYCETEEEALDKGAQKIGYKNYNELCKDVSDNVSYTCGVVDIEDLRADMRNKLSSVYTTNKLIKDLKKGEISKDFFIKIVDIDMNDRSINYIKNIGI